MLFMNQLTQYVIYKRKGGISFHTYNNNNKQISSIAI